MHRSGLATPSEGDDLHVRVHPLEGDDRLQPLLVWQEDIRHDQINGSGFVASHALTTRVRDHDPVSRVREDRPEASAEIGIIIDEQNTSHGSSLRPRVLLLYWLTGCLAW